jgi:hypothetical protein
LGFLQHFSFFFVFFFRPGALKSRKDKVVGEIVASASVWVAPAARLRWSSWKRRRGAISNAFPGRPARGGNGDGCLELARRPAGACSRYHLGHPVGDVALSRRSPGESGAVESRTLLLDPRLAREMRMSHWSCPTARQVRAPATPWRIRRGTAGHPCVGRQLGATDGRFAVADHRRGRRGASIRKRSRGAQAGNHLFCSLKKGNITHIILFLRKYTLFKFAQVKTHVILIF